MKSDADLRTQFDDRIEAIAREMARLDGQDPDFMVAGGTPPINILGLLYGFGEQIPIWRIYARRFAIVAASM